MTKLLRLVPADEENYPNYPAIELCLREGSYHVDSISVDGETEKTSDCVNLTASLTYMACVLARMPEIEYVVETLN